MRRRSLRSALRPCAALLLAAAGCNNLWIDPMKRQPKFKAYSQTAFFKDGRSMREAQPGTLPREMASSNPQLRGGDWDAGTFVEQIPLPVDRTLVERGRQRFNINCSPCHGALGDGDSVIAHKFLLRAPPSLLTDDIRTLPDGKIAEVIRAGYGVMGGYENQLTAADRWAVVAYVRALQVSQRSPLESAPADAKQRLMAERAQ